MRTSKVYYYTLKRISKFAGRFFMLLDQVAYIVLGLKDGMDLSTFPGV
jgi:hypothetical protein